MKKAPRNFHAPGALGHQLSLLPEIELSQIPPEKGTREELALLTLATEILNQFKWFALRKGWRLAVTINNLRNSGWKIKTDMKRHFDGSSYAKYSLADEKQRQLAIQLHRKRMEEQS